MQQHAYALTWLSSLTIDVRRRAGDTCWANLGTITRVALSNF